MPKRESVDRPTRERLLGHLRALMVEHHLNSRAIAKRLGVSPGTISSILKGTRDVGFDVFIRLHRHLEVSANYLLDSEPPFVHEVPSGRKERLEIEPYRPRIEPIRHSKKTSG